jgi:DNA-binding response OmpR family regulator
MERPLVGRSILILEDEPLIALDVTEALKSAGARVIVAGTLPEALSPAEEPNLSAAVLDHGLNHGDSSQVCKRLKERDIPFVIYSGFSKLDGACGSGVLVNKPAHPQVLVVTIAGLLRGGRFQTHNEPTSLSTWARNNIAAEEEKERLGPRF